MVRPKIKICGLTRLEDVAIALDLGVDWLGFNFVSSSKRYIEPTAAQSIWAEAQSLHRVKPVESGASTGSMAVFSDESLEHVKEVCRVFPELRGLQFHGQESAAYLDKCREMFPGMFVMKAVAVGDIADIARVKPHSFPVDIVLFDTARLSPTVSLVASTSNSASGSFPPKISGGTGRPFPWEWLASCAEELVFGVAGGVGPSNIADLKHWNPRLVDLNSGVEDLPGRKSAQKLQAVYQIVRGWT